jgi:hypothetical protein
MIKHKIYSNAFAYMQEYGQVDCGFSNLLFTDDDRPLAGGYVSFAPYSAGFQKRPYDGR